jgi:hypothetical protein
MFTRCLFCHTPFTANQVVERFPLAMRIAFDPGRGRLWAICDACRRWNLAPIEERWEALEELDRMATDRGRLLSQTDNIALIRAGPIELVRVGRARLVEEAWWRYGKELRDRRVRFGISRGVEIVALLGVSVLTGGSAFIYGANIEVINNIRRWRQFGGTAWRGAVTCPRCGTLLRSVSFKETRSLVIIPDPREGFGLQLRCPRCDPVPKRRAAVLSVNPDRPRLEGVAAAHVLRRSLAWRHFSGASEKTVREATAAIERAGSAADLTRSVAGRAQYLQQIDVRKNPTEGIALEIALNDETERRLLELELEELEARWREEEEIAAIADGELTPLPMLERIRLGRL